MRERGGYRRFRHEERKATALAIFALILGSTIGLVSAIISFFLLGFSFVAAFLTYQVIGVVLTFLIILWNFSGTSSRSGIRARVRTINA